MSAPVRIRLILADGGDFLVHEVSIPAGSLKGYDRLIDCLREDPEVLKVLHVDPERLVAAELLED